MPIGKSFVGHIVDALRLQGIGDVENDAIARTCPGRQLLCRENGNVVALVRLTGVLRAVAVIAAAPQTGNFAIAGKYPGPVNNAGFRWIGDGNLDHVDAEERRVITARAEAARNLFGIAHIACARIIHDQTAIVGVDDRMGMAAATGLHQPDLLGTRDVGDVENTQPAETLVADLIIDSFEAAVDPAPAIFDAHDQQIAGDRYIALSARAHHRADQLRHAVLSETISVETVVTTRNHHIAAESHIGESKAQQRTALAELGLVFLLVAIPARGILRFVLAFVALLDRLQLSRVFRVEESCRLLQRHHVAHVGNRLARVAKTGLQRCARIGRERRKRCIHSVDFGPLVADDIVGEFVHHRIVGAARHAMQFIHHVNRPEVVGDHELEKQAVEGGAVRGGQFAHLLRRRHSFHRVMGMAHALHGHVKIAVLQPGPHEIHFVFLPRFDPIGRL